MYSKIAFRNVKKSFKDFTVYFITLLLGVCIFYAFNSISSQAGALDMNDAQRVMMTLLGIAMKGISFVVAIILGFLVIYANRYLIKRRKAEFAVYLTLGMDRSKVSLIIVIETLLVGILSLVCGIVLGIIVSQGMLFVTAGMFDMSVSNFNLVFSGDACIATIIYFAIIFLVALIFNVATISRYKLINLINATKQNETVVLRNIRVTVVLFLVSLVCIGVAYWKLISAGAGIADSDNAPAFCAVLILVGTVLFFYSSGTFLLNAFKSRKKLYYKDVNMFVLRQISSRINTAFVSVSVVCIALFLAIVCVCLGFGLSSSLNQSLKNSTRYDASVSFNLDFTQEMKDIMSMFGVDATTSEANAAAQADGYDMLTAISRELPEVANTIGESAQINYYQTNVSYTDLAEISEGSAAKKYLSEMGDFTLLVVKVSDINRLRALCGEDEIELGENECILWTDTWQAQDALKDFGKNGSIKLGDKTLTFSGAPLVKTSAQTSMSNSNSGTLVVQDAVIDENPASATLMSVTLNINFSGADKEEAMSNFSEAINEKYGSSNNTWPVGSHMTAKDAKAWASGFSAIFAYLAIYIGLVLMVACAAILALQQMTEALDSAHRYNMLSKIGADAHTLNMALLRQVGAYFFYPFVLALAHACLMCWALKDVFSAFGMTDIVSSVAGTMGIVLVIYVVYFLITYLAARAIALSTKSARVA